MFDINSKITIWDELVDKAYKTILDQFKTMNPTLERRYSIQHELEDNEVLYFLHIPKTGGTTFTAILDYYFDNNRICPDQVWSEFNNGQKDFSPYKLIRGHFGYGLHRILDKNLVYVTMIRNPKNRIISHYDHIKYRPIGNHWVNDYFILENETLLEVLENPKKKTIFLDLQTRELALDLSEETFRETILKYPNYLHAISSFEFDYENLLKIAKYRLSQFTYFGLTERFDDSLFLLYYTFGWKPMKINYKLQITGITNKEQLSDETDAALQNCIHYDSELYDFAKNLFEERFSQMINDLMKKYFESRFEMMSFNEMMYELLEKHYNDRLGQSCTKQNYFVDFNFEKKMSGSGWYWRESQSGGPMYRWSGPTLESTLDFVLPRDKDLQIKFRIIDEAYPDNFKQLHVNGNEIKLIKIEEKERKTVYEGLIPKNFLKNNKNFTRFTFLVKQTKPNYYPLGPIGIAIDKIMINPVNTD